MNADDGYVWLNGRLVPSAEASVPFLTPALHYGIAVFEGIRCYATPGGPAIFRLGDHLDRLLRSAHILGFGRVPYDRDALRDAVHETITANRLDECYIRPLVYLAEGGWNLSIDAGRAHVGIAVWPWHAYLGPDALERGVRANVSSFARHHPNVMMTKAKIAGNYANSVLARTESVRLGFDEAIMLDPQGYVAECTGENLFVVSRGQLLTPPTGAILDGITRSSVISLAADAGYRIIEAPITRDDLYGADEVFVCGTAAEIVALREIDNRAVGDGRSGRITRELQQLYRDATLGRHARSEDWLEYVRPADRFAAIP